MFEVLIGGLYVLVTDKVEKSRKDRMKYLERRSDCRKHTVGWVASVVDGSVWIGLDSGVLCGLGALRWCQSFGLEDSHIACTGSQGLGQEKEP